MNGNNQSATLYLIAGGLILVLGAEYYFLTMEPAHTRWYLSALKFFGKGGTFSRILFIALYPLCFALTGGTLAEEKRRDESKNKLPLWLWLLLYASSACLLYSIDRNPYYQAFYPISLVGALLSGYPLGKRLRSRPGRESPVRNDRRKQENEYSFHLKGKDGSWVNITNPFRGILVVGGAGSGKSYSVAEPIIAQAAQKGYCGIIYDFKFPTLTNFAYAQYAGTSSSVGFWVVNFEDLEMTHRVNPLNPRYIPSAAYASEYALAIINNLIPESIQKPDFWIRSAQALLTATIWYLKKHHPDYYTLPHVVNLLVGEDHEALLDLLRQDYECASMIRSIVTAVDLKASSQIAGMISSLQVALARINSPEICYVLSGDEFDLDINHPASPKMLCIGSSPTLSDTFAPVIACLVAVATKQMNQQGKRHSFILLDEGPTLFIPKLDQLPATARSNKVATIYMTQDFSQMKKEYGQNESEAITSNLNNQFFGRVASLPTAEYVSRLFGRKEQLVRSEGRSDSRPESFDWGLNGRSHSGTQGSSVSYSLQERSLVHPQELLQLEVGQFMGTTVETESPTFNIHFAKHGYGSRAIPTIGTLPDAQLNFERIVLETKAIVIGRFTPTV